MINRASLSRESEERKRVKSCPTISCDAQPKIFSAAAFLFAATPAPAGSGYHVIKTIPIGGEGGWDYVYVDSAARRVYVSRGTHVVVVDAECRAQLLDRRDLVAIDDHCRIRQNFAVSGIDHGSADERYPLRAKRHRKE